MSVKTTRYGPWLRVILVTSARIARTNETKANETTKML